MNLLLVTENSLTAMRLKNNIIKAVKGEMSGIAIETWSYKRSADNYDIIYHNPPQYIDAPEKNVIFRVQLDGAVVSLSTAWWRNNPTPSKEMLCLHVGRMVEMLLRYFAKDYIKISIVD